MKKPPVIIDAELEEIQRLREKIIEIKSPLKSYLEGYMDGIHFIQDLLENGRKD